MENYSFKRVGYVAAVLCVAVFSLGAVLMPHVAPQLPIDGQNPMGEESFEFIWEEFEETSTFSVESSWQHAFQQELKRQRLFSASA